MRALRSAIPVAVALVVLASASVARADLLPDTWPAPFFEAYSFVDDYFPVMYEAMATISGGFVVFSLVKKGIRKLA